MQKSLTLSHLHAERSPESLNAAVHFFFFLAGGHENAHYNHAFSNYKLLTLHMDAADL